MCVNRGPVSFSCSCPWGKLSASTNSIFFYSSGCAGGIDARSTLILLLDSVGRATLGKWCTSLRTMNLQWSCKSRLQSDQNSLVFVTQMMMHDERHMFKFTAKRINKYWDPKVFHSGKACHPCVGAMLIFSVSFQFFVCHSKGISKAVVHLF